MNTLALLDSDDDMIDSNITIMDRMEESITSVPSNSTLDDFESPKARSSVLRREPYSKGISSRKGLVESKMSFRREHRMTVFEDTDETEDKSIHPMVFPSPTVSMTPIRPRASSATDLNTTKAESPVRIHSLPTLPTTGSVSFGRIESSTIISLIKSEGHASFMEKFIIVDCRYPYEYEGGHLKGAVNLFDPKLCGSMFYSGEVRTETRIPIFHCEFSQKRGPTMASTLRQIDRQRNLKNYPHLEFPEIYVLDGGYKGFYDTYKDSEHQDLFVPQCSYTAMSAKSFSQNLKKFSFHKSENVKAHTLAKKASSRRHLAFRHRNFESSPTLRTPTSAILFDEYKELSIPLQESPLASRQLPSNLSFS